MTIIGHVHSSSLWLVVFYAVRFDESLKVLVGNAIASTQTYGVELSLPYVVVYGQDVDLEDASHLFWG
jgi:hypothetical protein